MAHSWTIWLVSGTLVLGGCSGTHPSPGGVEANVDGGGAAQGDSGGSRAEDSAVDSAVVVEDASSGGNDGAAPACTEANKICVRVEVPQAVDPTKVVKLYIGFAKQKGGIPEIGKGTTLQPVTVKAGATYYAKIDNKGLSGQLFVSAGLYMNGGGTASPKAGIDYSAWSSKSFAFSSAAIELDEPLALALAQ